MRRYGETRIEGQVYTRRPGAYALLPRDGRILLTHQSAPEPEFQLPGGGIDPGETGISALHREVIEETGWRIGKPRRLGFFRRFVFMPEYDLWAEKICHVYVARPIREMHAPLEPDHEAIWADPITAVSLLGNAGDAAFLRAYLSSEGPL